jgi:hypothetical protein
VRGQRNKASAEFARRHDNADDIARTEYINTLRAKLASPEELPNGTSFSIFYDQDAEKGAGSWICAVRGSKDEEEVFFLLDKKDSDDLLGPQVEAWELMALGTPPVVDVGFEPFTQPSISWHENKAHYSYNYPCVACGGFKFDIPRQMPPEITQAIISDPQMGDIYLRRQHAEMRIALNQLSQDLEEQISEDYDSCPGCLSDSIISGEKELPNHPTPWFNVRQGEWMLYQPVDDEAGVNWPLGVSAFASPDEVSKAIEDIVRGGEKLDEND